MMNFSSKQLNQYETVAEILSTASKEKNVDLAKAEKALKVNKKYLLALEQGEYEKMPGEVYIRNFTRAYAAYLDLNVKNVLKVLDRELEITKKIGKTQETILQPRGQSEPRVIITPKIIRNSLIITLAILCIGYLGWEVNAIFSPPSLTLSSPAPDLISRDPFITVEGQTDPEAELTINGQQVLPDPNGKFSKQLDLQVGINTIEVKTKKKRSRENVIVRQIMVEGQSTATPTTPTVESQAENGAANTTQSSPNNP